MVIGFIVDVPDPGVMQRPPRRPGTKIVTRPQVIRWSSPVFPFLGWIILGWILTWAAVELNMLQRLLDTTSLSGREWIVVLALSLLAPAVVAVDKVIQLARQGKARTATVAEPEAQPALQAIT